MEPGVEEHTYRVWYNPYMLGPYEEDYIEITAQNEDEAVRRARTNGYVTEVELIECDNLDESVSTLDIEDALQNFINYNPNKNLDRIKKRIARVGEFDNGRVMHGDWKKISMLDAEELARKKSIENPGETYYVQYDDLMVGASDISWTDGQMSLE